MRHVRLAGGDGRGEHEVPPAGLQQALVVQCRVPAGQVVDGRIDAAVAEHRAGLALVGAGPSAVDRQAVPVGAARHRVHPVLVGDGVAHAQRLEDALLQEAGEILTGGGAHHQGQQRVATVAVAVVAAGGEVGAVQAFEDVQHVDVVQLALEVRRNVVLVVDQPGGVAEQVAQGDCIGGGRQRGQPARDRIVQRQHAVLGQQQDRRGGELLAHRRQPVVGLRSGRRAGFQVGQAMATTVQRLAIAQHQHRGAGHLALVVAQQGIGGGDGGGRSGGRVRRGCRCGRAGQHGQGQQGQQAGHGHLLGDWRRGRLSPPPGRRRSRRRSWLPARPAVPSRP